MPRPPAPPVPHPIPYQGSKRRLAASILRFVPAQVSCFVEPFAGSAAITLAAARQRVAKHYVLGERLAPLAELWRQIIDAPIATAGDYARTWSDQEPDPRAHYLRVRERFNRSGEPVLLLYLLARCVKNAVRFNSRGEFNQSADHRRKGMHPDRMRKAIRGASALLRGRCEVRTADYGDVAMEATPSDFVYLDPPYQGCERHE